MKRVLSFIIVVALTLSLLTFAPLSIQAADAAKLNLVADLGIVPPVSDYGIIPTSYTRADFARTLCVMSKKTDGLSYSDEYLKSKASDISSHKNAAYIATVIELGWMDIDGSKAFRPAVAVSQEDAVKAIIKMLGYEPMAQSSGGDFDAYYRIALKLNIFKGVKIANASVLSSSEVSQIVANAMSAYFFVPSNFSGMDECLWDRWGIRENKGRIIANPNMGMYVSRTNDKQVNIDGTIYYTELLIENEMVGSVVTYYTKLGDNGEEVISFYVNQLTENVTIKANEIESVSDDGTYITIKYDDKKSLRMIKSGFLIVNGTSQSPTMSIFNAFKSGTVTFIDTNSDSVFDTAQMTLLYQAVVDGVNAEKETLALRFENTIINLNNKEYSVYLGKNAVTVNEIKVGMVVGVAADRFTIAAGEITLDYTNSKYIQLYLSDRTDSGYITALIGTEQVEVAGLTRDIGSGYIRLADDGFIPELKLGAYIKAYYDNYGAFTYFETSTAGGLQYGYLIGAGLSGGFNTKFASIRLVDTLGEIHQYPLNKKVTLDGARVDADSVTYTINEPNDLDLTKRQLIRYHVDDGVVKEIDTKIVRAGVETADFSLDAPLAFSTSERKVRSNVINRRYALATNCIVFVDSAYDDETQPTERSFVVQKSLTTGEYTNLEGFDPNINNELACVVYKENHGKTLSGSVSTEKKHNPVSIPRVFSYVVQKVMKTTKDGEEGWTLYLAGEGTQEIAYASKSTVRLYEVAGMDFDTFKPDTGYDYYKGYERDVETFDTLIEKGDIVRFKKNTQGEITTIEKLFDFGTYKDSYYPMEEKEKTLSFVKVEKISGNYIIFSNGDNSGTTYIGRRTDRSKNYDNVILYHVQTGEVEIMPTSQIPSAATGNNVKCFIRYYDTMLYDNVFYIFD